MRIELTKEQVGKILSTMGAEEIEQKLDANYSYWNIGFNEQDIDGIELIKKEDVKKNK